MATWVTHFRIAERLLSNGLAAHKEEFLMGNIGPDCSYLSSDGAELIPPKTTTHYMINKDIDADAFYFEHLEGSQLNTWNPEQAFYLGYYIHLLCDQAWQQWHHAKQLEPLYQDIIHRPEYHYVVREDWYGLDFLYLKHHPEHIFWTTFQHISSCPDYMSFYEPGQITKQIRRIQKFYLTNTIAEDHVFRYVTMTELDLFVEETAGCIQRHLNERFTTVIE